MGVEHAGLQGIITRQKGHDVVEQVIGEDAEGILAGAGNLLVHFVEQVAGAAGAGKQNQ